MALAFKKTPKPSGLSLWVDRDAAETASQECSAFCKLIDRPRIDPSFPDDITQLTDEELGRLFGRFIAMVDYLEQETAKADVGATSLEARLAHVKAAVRLGKSGTIADRDTKTLNDEAYLAAELPALEAEAKAKLLRARLRGYDKCASALSREMSRREKIMEHMR
jgi:hypothetical protein